MTAVEIVVENAGCSSCGAVIRDALASFGEIEALTIDEAADTATIRLSGSSTTAITAVDLDRALAAAGDRSGHAYRVRRGSFTYPA